MARSGAGSDVIPWIGKGEDRVSTPAIGNPSGRAIRISELLLARSGGLWGVCGLQMATSFRSSSEFTPPKIPMTCARDDLPMN